MKIAHPELSTSQPLELDMIHIPQYVLDQIRIPAEIYRYCADILAFETVVQFVFHVLYGICLLAYVPACL
jgi:hypothetical protein